MKGLPEKMKLYSEFLGKQPWFIGDKVKGREMDKSCCSSQGTRLDSISLALCFLQISYVDFLVYDILDQHCIFEPKCLDAFPNLKDFLARFEVKP